MSEPKVVKAWLSSTAAGLDAAVEKLKVENPQALFVMLARAAASGDWDNTFVPAFERASGIKGIKLLLPMPDGFPMKYAYERAMLPGELWPVFLAVLEMAVAVARDAGDALRAGKRLRELVFDRAFAVAAPPDLLRAELLA